MGLGAHISLLLLLLPSGGVHGADVLGVRTSGQSDAPKVFGPRAVNVDDPAACAAAARALGYSVGATTARTSYGNAQPVGCFVDTTRDPPVAYQRTNYLSGAGPLCSAETPCIFKAGDRACFCSDNEFERCERECIQSVVMPPA